MSIPFPSDINNLNVSDFDILKILYLEGPLWKMEITRKVNSDRKENNLPFKRKENISKQAIARRVERLHELDFIEKAIISLENIDSERKPDRDFIEGYQINEKGEKSLENILKSILLNVLNKSIESEKSIKSEESLEIYNKIKDEDFSSLVEFVDSELP